MKIGFDFDKVFVDYPPFVSDRIIDFLYKVKNHDVYYRFPSFPEQKIRIFSHNLIFRPPIEENIKALSELSRKKDLRIYLVSGRFGFLREKTQKWLEKYNLRKFFIGVYFNFNNDQPHLFKEKTIKKIGIQKYVDDDLDILTFLSKQKFKTELYWLNSKNHSVNTVSKRINIIKNLKEFQKNLKI